MSYEEWEAEDVAPWEKVNANFASISGGTNPAAFNSATTATAFGDSITVGDGSTSGPNSYIELIAAARGWTITNEAVSSTQAADCATDLFQHVVADDSQTLLMIGTNDARVYNSDTVLQGVYKRAHLALAAWAAIPDARKVYAQDAASTGSWTNNAGAYGGGLAVYSTSVGATRTFTVYGTVVYLCSLLQDDNTSTFTVAVDGVTVGTYSNGTAGAVSLETYLGLDYAPNLIRIPGLSEGEHTVVVTVASSAGSNPYVHLLWAAGNQGHNSKDGPNVWVGNIPRLNSTGYATLGGSDAIFAVYNAIVRANVNTLATDGLNVGLVDSASRLLPASDLDPDGIHPDDSGHQKIADAFLEAINQIGKPWASRVPPIGPLRITKQTGTSYTLALADVGADLQSSNGSGQTITLPPDNSVPIDINDTGVITAMGSGTVTIAAGSGVTVNSLGGDLDIGGQYASVFWQKTGANTFLLRGSLA